MNLCIEPQTALVDEKLSINLSGLAPYEKVKISAAMNLPWVHGEKYGAFGIFTADNEGNIDLSKQKPEEGTYDWQDSMGLITSLKKVSSEGADLTAGISADQPLKIEFTAEHKNGTETVAVQRIFKNDSIQTQKIKEPFIGELFHTGNSGAKTVIILGGSGDGGTDPLSLFAGPLASHGFNVLTVGYYGAKGLPDQLQNVPLEYFEKVINWIQENPRLNSKDICLHGTSKGGELALLLASKYDVLQK